MRISNYVFLFILTIFSFCHSNSYHFFTPPQNWKLADPEHLSPMVEMCFLGKSKTSFYPSINIATEEIDVSEKKYFSIVKEMHKNDPNIEFHEFGKIKTKAGFAKLLELTTKTKFGEVKMLQAVLIKDNKAYVLTGAMHIDDYKIMSKTVLDTFKSFQIVNNLLGCLQVDKNKETLLAKLNELSGLKSTSDRKWKKFEKYLIKNFKNMGEYWQVLVMRDAYNKYIIDSK